MAWSWVHHPPRDVGIIDSRAVFSSGERARGTSGASSADPGGFRVFRGCDGSFLRIMSAAATIEILLGRACQNLAAVFRPREPLLLFPGPAALQARTSAAMRRERCASVIARPLSLRAGATAPGADGFPIWGEFFLAKRFAGNQELRQAMPLGGVYEGLPWRGSGPSLQHLASCVSSPCAVTTSALPVLVWRVADAMRDRERRADLVHDLCPFSSSRARHLAGRNAPPASSSARLASRRREPVMLPPRAVGQRFNRADAPI